MRTQRSARLVVLLGTAAAALALPSAAQSPPRVLHRPIPGDLPLDEREDAAPLLPPASSQSVSQAAGAANAWREHQPVDENVTRPRESWETPVRELDRDTRSPPGASLHYAEVFTPSVTPFKRLQAYDVVDEYGRLTVRDPSLRAVDTGEGPAPARWNRQSTGRFVGDVNVEVSPAWPTPIPSIAGDVRVVSYTTSTGHALEFVQDSAGNLFVRGTTAETVRLSYVLEAPQSAFAAPFVPSEPLIRAAAGVPIAARPNVPAWLQTHAEEVLRAAAVSRGDPLNIVVGGLVAYFRSFRDADLPESTGQNLYADLALSRVGACRHRAYAFVLTLHALGIEARYVGNEAHAWAEVNFRSGTGWSRIDLGGWDIPLEAQAPTDRPQFHPSNADVFPHPPGYDSQYSARAATDTETHAGDPTTTGGSGNGGGPQVSSAGSGAMPDDGEPGAANSSGASSSASQNGGGAGTVATGNEPSGNGGVASGTANSAAGVRGGGMASAPAVTASGSRAGIEEEEEPVRTLLTVGTVEADQRAGYAIGTNGFVRGSMVIVRGEVRDASGAALPNLPVEIQLMRDRRVVATIGRTVSQPDGHWEAQSQLPFDLATGDYTLRANTAGDRGHTSATAE